MSKIIPFFNYCYHFTKGEPEILKVVSDVGRRGAFIMQDDLAEFERKLAEYTGAKYAVGVANATDGLQMVLMAEGVGPGDEVIVCSHTMVATASAVYFTGATPVPVEVGADHLIDPASVKSAITARTRLEKQTFTFPAPMARSSPLATRPTVRFTQTHGLVPFNSAIARTCQARTSRSHG